MNHKKRFYIIIVTAILSLVSILYNFYLNNEEGKRINAFYDLTKNDPLFTSEPQFENILNLEKSIKIIGKLNKYLIKENSLNDNLFPINYLEQYVKTLKSQKKFFKNIDKESGENYIEDMTKLSEYYEKDVLELSNQIKNIIKENENLKNLKLVTLWNYTNLEIISKDFILMKKNAIKLKNETELRKKCFLESEKFCKSNLKYAKTKMFDADNSYKNRKTNFIGIYNKGIHQKNENELIKSEYSTGNIFKIKTKCFGDENEYIFFDRRKTGFADLDYYFTDLATKKFYKTLGTGSLDPVEKEMVDKGLKLMPTNLTTSYKCMDYSYHANIVNLNRYIKIYLKEPFFTKENFKGIGTGSNEIISLFEKGSEIEVNFLKNDYYNEDDFRDLANLFHRILVLIENKSIKKNVDNFKIIDDIIHRMNSINGNLLDMDMLFNNIYKYNLNFIMLREIAKQNGKNSDIIEKPEKNFDKINLYSYHLNYSIFFMNFSPFIWRIDDNPIYSKKAGDINEMFKRGKILSENDALNKYSKDEIAKWKNIYSSYDRAEKEIFFFKRNGLEKLISE